jgi:Di-haem oxidoreductase, putative peroxidase
MAHLKLVRNIMGAMALGAVFAYAIGVSRIGQEVAVPVHLQDGQEFQMTSAQLAAFGKTLFTAMWTSQEGAGRPMTKGTGNPISDPASPLVFPRNFNRISGPDTNSCSGCHNKPDIGGGGDIVGNVFVLGQRFDFATFDSLNPVPTGGGVDEIGNPVFLQTIADSRKTVGMFGSGYLEMVARQMTADLRSIRDNTPLGASQALVAKGVSFGMITRNLDGTWDTSKVVGLPPPALATSGTTPPDLIIRPYHQASNVISVRQFTNNAFNHHHGMQSEERFGIGTDPDGDGVVNELTRADITAATIFQITLPVPGRVIPSDPEIRHAIRHGEKKFDEIGCTNCHLPSLPLDKQGWIYSEPNPYNPAGNLQVGQAPTLYVDLTDAALPPPRLRPKEGGVIHVPALTDLKVHDITNGLRDPNCEPLNMNRAAGSMGFFAGNCQFITRKLWGIANQHSFGHHGLYTTMREATLAHAGEALGSRMAFQNLSIYDQDSVIEFLKSLQILPAGTKCTVVDENMNCAHSAEMSP